MPAHPKPLSPPYLFPGGSRRHADFVLTCVPGHFGSYVEPFLGGGAVAIALMERMPSTTFHLSSDDAELVNTWQVLQTAVDDLVRAVVEHRERHDRAYAARLGALDAAALAGMSPVERAARFIYLRGSAGRDAVAFDETNVRRVGALLAECDARLQTRGFFQIVSEVAEEDLVYLDPPFAPGAPASLEREVRSLVGTVTARGAFLLAPGASAPYADWNTMTVAADRGDGDVLWANRTLDRARRR